MASIKDVAKLAGVSPAAISKYFKTPENMKQETKDKITKAIETLHFRPNQLARSLRMGHSNIIAIAIPEVDNPYFNAIFKRIQSLSSEKGLLPLLLKTNSEREISATVDLLKSGLVDGAICYDAGSIDVLISDEEIHIPLVRLSPLSDSSYPASIFIDLRTGMNLLCAHLESSGAKVIGWIGPTDDASSRQKFNTVKEFCATHTLMLDKDVVLTNCYGYNESFTCCEQMLSSVRDLPDAIICESDMIAMGVLKSLSRHGVAVPEEIMLAGYDNTDISLMSNPSVTSVDIPLEGICRKSLEMLCSLIDGQTVEPIIFQTDLEIRTSTKRE
ncbi:MAG: LacI family transcriptional regulator [Oscillibacter sp.]|nr:LacI family transcriptional regulator [Oscillibacter sp.]